MKEKKYEQEQPKAELNEEEPAQISGGKENDKDKKDGLRFFND